LNRQLPLALPRLKPMVAFIALIVVAVVRSGLVNSAFTKEVSNSSSVHDRSHSLRGVAYPRQPIECPGGGTCTENTCCLGVVATKGKSFPCPASSVAFRGCDMGQDGIVAAMLAELNREEKYHFLRGTGWIAKQYKIRNGFYVGNAGLNLRFGIPSLNMNDGGSGFRTFDKQIIDQVTSWPCALAVAALWSESDVHRWAATMGQEFRSKGANVVLGPGVEVHRVARGGRNAEYLAGESPYLGARLVGPWVRGMQSQKVLAVVKHFVCNNQETNRNHVDSIVDPRTLWEVYYPPFQAAVDAGVAAVMCAYNFVNHVQACNNSQILLTDLRRSMGFGGWVMSDWWALTSFAAQQGVDQEMPGDPSPDREAYFSNDKLDTLSDAQVDSMVASMLTKMLQHGLFEASPETCQPPHCDHLLFEAIATKPEHEALSRDLATKAVMLLKNEGQILPFGASVKKIALLGHACNASQNASSLVDVWDGSSYYTIGGSGRVLFRDPVSIHAGLVTACERRGCEIIGAFTDDSTLAVEMARGADVAILCGGATSTEGKDRKNLSVDQQSFMVEAASKLSMPVVSLTMTPGAIVMPWAEHVSAVLNVFLAGKHTGTAFAAVLFGDSNPSAKSPITFPKNEKDVVQPCPQTKCYYTEKLRVGWRGLKDDQVTFPFGHGLSYTNFSYSSLKIAVTGSLVADVHASCSAAVACVSARVTNIGHVKGAEVAQLYLGFPEGSGEPPKVLKGFDRTRELEPGAFANVSFALATRDVQTYDGNAGRWETPDGVFQIYVGTSSRDVRLTSAFSMCRGKPSLELDPACK